MTALPADLGAEERERILTQSSAHFRNPSGSDLLKRTEVSTTTSSAARVTGCGPSPVRLRPQRVRTRQFPTFPGTAREGINFCIPGLSGPQSASENCGGGHRRHAQVRSAQRRLGRPARQYETVHRARATSGRAAANGAHHALSDGVGGRIWGHRRVRASARSHCDGLSVARLSAAGGDRCNSASDALQPQRHRRPQSQALRNPGEERTERDHGRHRGAVLHGLGYAGSQILAGGLPGIRRDIAGGRGT